MTPPPLTSQGITAARPCSDPESGGWGSLLSMEESMSEYPKYLCQELDGQWMLDDDDEATVIKRAERHPKDRAVYRIDAATLIWPEPVTYSVVTDDWRMNREGLPLDVAEESFSARTRVGSDLRGRRTRIIDSTGKVIREYAPPKVEYRLEAPCSNGIGWSGFTGDATANGPDINRLINEARSRATDGLYKKYRVVSGPSHNPTVHRTFTREVKVVES